MFERQFINIWSSLFNTFCVKMFSSLSICCYKELKKQPTVRIFLKYIVNVFLTCDPLKTENRHDAKFAVTGGVTGCRYGAAVT